MPLPSAFNRLAWSNLAAQSAEQIGLAAAPIVAVLALGAGAGATVCSRPRRRCRSCCCRSPPACSPIVCRAGVSWSPAEALRAAVARPAS